MYATPVDRYDDRLPIAAAVPIGNAVPGYDPSAPYAPLITNDDRIRNIVSTQAQQMTEERYTKKSKLPLYI